MTNYREELINTYRQKIKSANKELTKKEIFKDLLNRLYSGEKEITPIIDKITSGAEKTILNIPRKDKMHRGSADALYNRIIIEFENNLKQTETHAKEQLSGYFLGQFNSGQGYNFTLIASDFLTWKVYAPDVSQLEVLGQLTEEKLILNEIKSATFTLNETNTEDFYFWIDRFLFKEEKQKATLKLIEESFGYQSNVFIECFREMTTHYKDVKKFGQVQVSYEQWNKFLSVAYGTFDGSETNFLIHTYLSIFSKMLAYTVVSNNDFIKDETMLEIIDGKIFENYNIKNFVDTDFFYWIKNETSFTKLKKVFRLIAQEISTFDFANVDEDILKGVYQELIDLDTRHALGEYYTPDWLCERIVNEFNFKSTNKILDPSCGSGSFLRAAIHRLKHLHPNMSGEQLTANVYGIDIHPLSVQIAKTTVLLSLGVDISKSTKPIHLNIIQANTLLAPDGVKDLFGGTFEMSIDKQRYKLNTQIFEVVQLFDEALYVCETVAEQTQNRKKESIEDFEKILKKQHKNGGITPQITESFYKIYLGLKEVKEKKRDSIWKFILQNLYKPYFLADKFDYVIGNPPWFTYSSIKNEEYQQVLNALAIKQNVKPKAEGTFPHLEIAAIFLSYCSSYFLKAEGEIAFVLPRSFFVAKQHDNTRSGLSKGFKLTNIWDFQSVSPLFRIPSCALFAKKVLNNRKNKEESLQLNQLPKSGLNGKSFSGNLPKHNCNLVVAKPKLTELDEKWFYVNQGNSTAFSNKKNKAQTKINPYKKLFKQGAIIVPRVFYFVDVAMAYPKGWEKDFDWRTDRTLVLKTAESIKPDSKAPWKGIEYTGKIESEFIYRTALSRSILPFALYKPDLIVLPIIIEKNNEGEKIIKLYNALQIKREGYLNANVWFENVERIWTYNKTPLNKKYTSEQYINYQNKLTSQNLNAKYLVLYNSSAKDANATVLIRKDLDLEFIVESVSYVYYTNNLDEAYYLTSILNSSVPNLLMKDFQAKGLFGARHVHKRILDIYYPKFDRKNELHNVLSQLSKAAHKKTKKYLLDNPPQQLTAIHLGNLRTNIKKHLTTELLEIDTLVKKII
jgi:methylase of polypeptide subunit release factors